MSGQRNSAFQRRGAKFLRPPVEWCQILATPAGMVHLIFATPPSPIQKFKVQTHLLFAILSVPLFAVLLVFSKCKCVFASLFVVI